MTIRTTISFQPFRLWLSGRTTVGRVAVICSAIALMTSSCTTTKGNRYTPRTLPPELLAQKRDNAQTLDLTQLARASNNSEVIERGDVIEVSISVGLDEKDTVRQRLRVNDEGIVNIPEVGAIRLAGIEMQAAEVTITAACIERQLYRNPNVTVTMDRQRMNRVTVIGAVKNPDVYELPRGKSDLLAAIVAAGGLDKDAGTRVEIRNPRRTERTRSVPVASGLAPAVNPAGHTSAIGTDSITEDGAKDTSAANSESGMESIQVDLVSATKSKSGGYAIEDGGVVRIEKRDPEPLHVMGLVKKPDRYEFPIAEEVRVTDAIALAGGTTLSMADKVFVIRRVPNSSETALIQVSLREAKRNAQANVRLEPSDVVSVEITPATALYETFNLIRFNAGMSVPAAGIF